MSFKPIPNLSGTQANFTGSVTMAGLTVATQSWVSSQNYLTSETDDQTLDEVLAQGNVSASGITVGSSTISGAGTSTFTVDSTNSFGRELTLSTNGFLPTISANTDLLIETSNSDTQIKLEGGGSTDNIQFIANEVEQVRITTAGVGIGTTSPAQKLHINGGIARFSNNSSNYLEIDGSDSANNHAIISNRFNQLQFKTNTGAGAPHISLLPATGGNVGIGTASPVDTLDIKDSNPRVRLIDTSVANDPAAYMWNSEGSLLFRADVTQARANTYIRFDIDQSEKLRITDTGKVGIGTTSPSWKLHVNSFTQAAILGYSTPWKSDGVAYIGSYYGTHTPLLVDHHNASTNSSNFAEFRNGDDDIAIKLKADGSADFAGDLAVSAGNIKGSSFTIGTDTAYTNDLNITNSGKIRIGNAEFFAKSSNDLSIYSAKLNVTSTGNVGIGTTSPTEKLHIESGNLLIKPNAVSASHSGLLLGINKYNSGKAGLYGATDGAASNTDGNLYISTRNVSSSNGSYIQLGQRSSTTTSDKGTIVLQAGKYNTNSQTGDILLKYGITDTLTLQGSSGNVGIGTTSPSKKLDVAGDIKSEGLHIGTPYAGKLSISGNFRHSDGDGLASLIYNSESSTSQRPSGLNIRAGVNGYNSYSLYVTDRNANPILLAHGNGNVGIGTSSTSYPSEKLEVIGNIKSSGSVEIGSSSAEGVILTSPGGSRFLISINNSGELQSTSL